MCSGGGREAPGSAPPPRFRSTACLVMPRPDDYYLKKSSKGPEAPTAPTSASLNATRLNKGLGRWGASLGKVSERQDLIYLDPGHFREIAERGGPF